MAKNLRCVDCEKQIWDRCQRCKGCAAKLRWIARKPNFVPWNKGLTKEIDERLKSIGLKNKSRVCTLETRLKLSKSLKGKTAWNKGLIGELSHMYGKKHSLGYKHTKEFKSKMSKLQKGNKWRIGYPSSMEGKEHTLKTKEKMRLNKLQLWANEKYRKKVIRAQVLGRNSTRPTSLEKDMIRIIQKHNLPYRYTGDGSFLIGYKNPDFVNVNGEKIAIEVANVFWHKPNYEEERIKIFKEYGWKSIIFMSKTNKLNEDKVLEKIEEVSSNFLL